MIVEADNERFPKFLAESFGTKSFQMKYLMTEPVAVLKTAGTHWVIGYTVTTAGQDAVAK
jgi:hypothetical protein